MARSMLVKYGQPHGKKLKAFIKQRSSTEKVVGFIPSLEPVIEERTYEHRILQERIFLIR